MVTPPSRDDHPFHPARTGASAPSVATPPADAVLAACPDPMFVVGVADGVVRMATPAAQALAPDGEARGRRIDEILTETQRDGRAIVRAAALDSTRCFEARAALVEDGASRVLLLRDVTERERERDALQALTLIDPLTGLDNRRGFDRSYAAEVRRMARARKLLSLLLIDVDGLKACNDALGHKEGDGRLRRVAAALREAGRRPGDVAARIGGDEFGLVLPDTEPPGVRLIADRIHAKLRSTANDAEVVTVSIGAATMRVERDGAATVAGRLFDAADAALYRAKADGGATTRVAPNEF